MPIYEYRCEHCGYELEAMQKLVDAPLSDCPACEQSTLRKLISPVAFRLKGSGWYETDFKTGDKKNVVEGTSEDSSDTSTKTETKNTETKNNESGDKKTTPKTTDSTTSETQSSTSKPSQSNSKTSSHKTRESPAV